MILIMIYEPVLRDSEFKETIKVTMVMPGFKSGFYESVICVSFYLLSYKKNGSLCKISVKNVKEGG